MQIHFYTDTHKPRMRTFGSPFVGNTINTHIHSRYFCLTKRQQRNNRSFDGLDEKANKETTSNQCSKPPPHPIEKKKLWNRRILWERCHKAKPITHIHQQTKHFHTICVLKTETIRRMKFIPSCKIVNKNRILSSFYLSNLKRPPVSPLAPFTSMPKPSDATKIQIIVTAPPPPTQGDWTTT